MGALGVSVLGPPEIHHDGHPLALPTRKALALLIYLAVDGRLHARERLAALLWPRSDEAQGRSTLRSLLSGLRRSLGEDGGAPHLIMQRAAVGLDPAAGLSLDLQHLEAAVALARVASAGAGPSESIASQITGLAAVADLCRGPLLQDFSLPDAPDFDEWATRQRAHWQPRIDLVFERLAHLSLERGEAPTAERYVARWLALNPSSEAAYRQQMQASLALGDHDAARAAYQACRTMLAHEYGAVPAPETQALAARIHPRAPVRLPVPAPRGVAALPPAPLVGRAAEFGAVVAGYQRAAAGLPQVVMVEGEAGIGKTHLLEAFRGWALAQGADVLHGRAREMGGRLPYGPLVASLRQRLDEENAPDDLLADVWLAELARLLPELRERYPDLPVPAGEADAARPRMFEAVARLGQALAARRPLVLCVEDAQWADIASRDLLLYMTQRWAESRIPVLLAVSLRAEDLALDPELVSWVAALEREAPLTRLRLGVLDRDAVQHLVEALVGTPADDGVPGLQPERVTAFGRWLFRETGGHPFFLSEVVKALLDRGILGLRPRADGAWALDLSAAVPDGALRGVLPPGIRALVQARLTRLSHGAAQVAAAAAVLGQQARFDRLYRVAGLDETEALRALEEAAARAILHLRPRDGGRGSGSIYDFPHDKLREVVYTEAGETRRRVLHGRALALLEAEGATAADLAHHALAAGLAAPAFRFSVAAGEEAQRVFALREALAHYLQAQEILDEQGSAAALAVTPPDLARLYLPLGRLHEVLNQPDAAQQVYAALLARARVAGEAALAGAALTRLATLAAQHNRDVPTAQRLLHEAQEAAERSGDRALLAETTWGFALLASYVQDFDATHTHGTRALTLAREVGRQDVVARCLDVLGRACWFSGRLEEAIAYSGEGRVSYAALGDRIMEANCLTTMAAAQVFAGRAAAGIAAARQAGVLCEEVGNTWGQAQSSVHLALGLLECGAYGEALAVARRAVAAARELTFPPLLCGSLWALGTVYAALQDPERACATHREALAVAQTMDMRQNLEMVRSALCIDRALLGQWEQAHADAVAALAARDYAWLTPIAAWRWIETQALAQGGDGARAAEDLRRFAVQISATPHYRGSYLHARAVLARRDGDVAQAAADLREASALAEAVGLPGEGWRTQMALGALLRQAGDERGAEQWFARAAAIRERLAATINDAGLRATLLAAAPLQALVGAGPP